MVKDYKEFLEIEKCDPSPELDGVILGKIKKEMRPSVQLIFVKMLAIQAFVGTITLLFCPQFNFSLTNSYTLFHIIHQTFGHYVCMVVCGSIFLGSGTIFAALLLNRYELAAIGRSYPLYLVALTGIAMMLFIFIGTDIYIDLASLWMLGAIVSGTILFGSIKMLRTRTI